MSKVLALGLVLLTLAACGVDGAPTRPGANDSATTGVSASGTVKAGVTGGG